MNEIITKMTPVTHVITEYNDIDSLFGLDGYGRDGDELNDMGGRDGDDIKDDGDDMDDLKLFINWTTDSNELPEYGGICPPTSTSIIRFEFKKTSLARSVCWFDMILSSVLI